MKAKITCNNALCYTEKLQFEQKVKELEERAECKQEDCEFWKLQNNNWHLRVKELETENQRLSELFRLSSERDEVARKDLIWNIERIKKLEEGIEKHKVYKEMEFEKWSLPEYKINWIDEELYKLLGK